MFSAGRVSTLVPARSFFRRAAPSRALSTGGSGAPPPGGKAEEAGGSAAADDAGVDEPILARASRLIWAGIKMSAGVALMGGLLYCGYNIVMVLLPVRGGVRPSPPPPRAILAG